MAKMKITGSNLPLSSLVIDMELLLLYPHLTAFFSKLILSIFVYGFDYNRFEWQGNSQEIS